MATLTPTVASNGRRSRRAGRRPARSASPHTVLDLVRDQVDRDPPVRDLGRGLDRLGRQRGPPDRDVGTQRIVHHVERPAQPRALAGRERHDEGRAGVDDLLPPPKIRHTLITSTMRDRGFLNGTPQKPSITCGPELPRPRMNRPPDSWSRLAALVAMAVGVTGEDVDDAGRQLHALGLGREVAETAESVETPRLARADDVEPGLLHVDDPAHLGLGGRPCRQSRVQPQASSQTCLRVGDPHELNLGSAVQGVNVTLRRKAATATSRRKHGP